MAASNAKSHGGGGRRHQLACLYTRHKTQKRKVWKDGRLVLDERSGRAVLHDADPPPGAGDPSLGESELSPGECLAILRDKSGALETERYLVEVEGPWGPATNPATNAGAAASTNTETSAPRPLGRSRQGLRARKNPMDKLYSSKFQTPGACIPPPSRASRAEQVLAKRKRPLQPGELVAMHHGGGKGPQGAGDRFGLYRQQQQPQYHHQQQRQASFVPHHPQPHLHPQQGPTPRDRYQGGHCRPPVPGRTEERTAGNPSALPPQLPVPPRSAHRGSPPGNPHTPPASAAPPAPPGPWGFTARGQRFGGRRGRGGGGSHGFAQNEFDAARYYGMDDDDDDQEEDEGDEGTEPLSVGFSIAPAIPPPHASPSEAQNPSVRFRSGGPSSPGVGGWGSNHQRDRGEGNRHKIRASDDTEGVSRVDTASVSNHPSGEERDRDPLDKSHGDRPQPGELPPSDPNHNPRQQPPNDPRTRSQPPTHTSGRMGVREETTSSGYKARDEGSTPPSQSTGGQTKKLDADEVRGTQGREPARPPGTNHCNHDEERDLDSESDSDDESHHDDRGLGGVGWPSSFRLKPFEQSPSDGTANQKQAGTGFTASSSSSSLLPGNRLLALFGAASGTGGDGEKENSVPKAQGTTPDNVAADKPGGAATATNDVDRGPNPGKPAAGCSGFYLAPTASSSEESSSDSEEE